MNYHTSAQIKQLLDTSTECLDSLKNLKIAVDNWDPLIIFLLSNKLDQDTRVAWEEYSYKENQDELPTWLNLKVFLEAKFRTLELTTSSASLNTREYKIIKQKSFHVTTDASSIKTCIKCKGQHTLCHCKEFIKLTPEGRSEYVKVNNLCFNCLGAGHTSIRCRLRLSCKLCRLRHHSLLHQRKNPMPRDHNVVRADQAQERHDEQERSGTASVELCAHVNNSASAALLATALLPVKDEQGNITILRALADSGSQASFISERAAQSLRLKRTPINGTVTGVGSTKTNVKYSGKVILLSRHDTSFNMEINVYIIPTQLTTYLPSQPIPIHTWSHLQGLVLADPSYSQPGRIDMLLGVDVYAQIVKSEVIKGPPGLPCAQNTSLGWILFGHIQNRTLRDEVIAMHLNLDLDDMLKKMWEQDTDEQRKPTAEERRCEEIYQATTTRTDEGRYIVKLPTKRKILLSPQGETRGIALKRLYQLEKRCEQNADLKESYQDVISEYLNNNYLEEVPTDELEKPAVYLPYHAIIKEEKETSKVRLVYNASQKGNNNISLNDELLIGTQLQGDMRTLIMRWRMRRICFVADIRKMYLMILVTKQDRNLQRIVWRSNKNEPVKDYRLTRLTFGTASAPYLAVKTLHQVADNEGNNKTDAVNAIKQDFYMDYLMSGKDKLEDAIQVAKDIESILKKGGFHLQKWCSNNAEFLKQFDAEQRSVQVNLEIKLDGIIKALGLQWNMGKYIFQYSYNLAAISATITKRTILADVQRLFDPLGWIAPAILPAKLLIQKLWLQGITWDEEVCPTIAAEWIELRNSFKHLPEVKIDRWLHTTENGKENVTIQGFCDASARAYAAVAYLRTRNDKGQIQTSLIAAKTRVASIKSKSLPRLELCGAVLLAGLLKQIKDAMNIPTCQVFAWTDSTIILSWLFGDPARWNTYVRNRVIEILDAIGNRNWYHVRSQDIPADVASRGKLLDNLNTYNLWWKGPKWLNQGEIIYTRPTNITTNLESKLTINTNCKIKSEKSVAMKFKDFDTFVELLKTIVYCKRFLSKIEDKEATITTQELEETMKTCVKIIQKDIFEDDINNLKINKRVTKQSKLKYLQQYLDKDEVLRVGGRLRHSDIHEDSKYPIILDDDNPLTLLIVDDAHKKMLHGGPQLMLNYIRTRFWILKAKKVVKRTVKKCILCARYTAVGRSQMMGDLPRERVTPARPFLNSGVDFAGPYQVLRSSGRGVKTNKSYIAIFVCMCTKAVHLELVGDLTSEAFIGSFKRFVSRRGRCLHLWSDQGRNFVGANKELATAWAEAKLEFKGQIAESLALDGTQWHFIPAYSPHMGGLWEAGVRSIKYHLKRVLTSHLTFEEMTTLLCQVEACLNSRPISQMEENDATNIIPLTPGHFLIGEAPITVPMPNLQNVPMNHLSRWQHLQKLLTDFWQRWQREYLSRLQQRPKWYKKAEEFEIGKIVIIKQDNLPPSKWMLGRIVDKHPGADGVTRAYSVKSGDNIVKRSTLKLCPMPIDTET